MAVRCFGNKKLFVCAILHERLKHKIYGRVSQERFYSPGPHLCCFGGVVPFEFTPTFLGVLILIFSHICKLSMLMLVDVLAGVNIIICLKKTQQA